jgi:hypothetical protein
MFETPSAHTELSSDKVAIYDDVAHNAVLQVLKRLSDGGKPLTHEERYQMGQRLWAVVDSRVGIFDAEELFR